VSTESKEAIDRLIDLGAALGAIREPPKGDPFVIVPVGFKTESLAPFLPPARIKQNVVMLEAGSFADYVNRFKTDNTLIFADVTDTGAKFVAILDYHEKATQSKKEISVTEVSIGLKANYCSHTARFECITTKEWQDWMANNGKRMDQVAFATFLEENMELIQTPPGATLLEIVQTLHGHVDARFVQATRLQSGRVTLSYDEDVVVKGNSITKEGAVDLPTQIIAGIAPFQGTEKYEVKARLKYRIENRKLSLWYETISPHRIIRDAVLNVTKEISEKTGIIPFIGRP
jgi:uncharacterized protein YfdQ (DUF2303 family)